MAAPETDDRTSPLKLALAWIIVSAPLAWGVYQSVVKSLPLFDLSLSAPANPSAGAATR